MVNIQYLLIERLVIQCEQQEKTTKCLGGKRND